MLSVLLASMVCVPPPPDGIETYTMSNGLRVVLERQRTFPSIAVHVLYGVGSADDPREHPGLVHLVEHLGTDQTKHVYHGTTMAQLFWRGATNVNATTEPDYTSYFETVPAAELDVALWIESDRMGFLTSGVREQSLRAERDIVTQEEHHRNVFYQRRVDTERVWRALFPAGHPYARVFTTNVKQVAMNDVHALIDRYYGPNNAVLVLVGDLPRDARARVDKYFKGLEPRVKRAKIPPRESTIRRVDDYDTANGSKLVSAWAMPSRRSREYRVARVLAQLVNMRDIRLHGMPGDLDGWARVIPNEVSSIFWLEGRTRSEFSKEALHEWLDFQLAAVKALPAEDLKAATRGVRIDALYDKQRFEDRAYEHAVETVFADTGTHEPSDVTAEELAAFIDQLLAASPVMP